MNTGKSLTLGALSPGAQGRIVSVKTSDQALQQRLLELGFVEGAAFELVHQAPFGGDPIAVRVRGALLALRRADASTIEVDLSAASVASVTQNRNPTFSPTEVSV
jgi:ferrous iron transport protein A